MSLEHSSMNQACQERWFAIYTAPRHEKRVAERIREKLLDVFLPVYASERKWQKRQVTRIELPLFPGYVFARFQEKGRGTVLSTPGVHSIIGNGRQPLPVPDHEIETLRSGLMQRRPEPHPVVSAGEKVRIKSGPLAGLTGVIIRPKNGLRVVIEIKTIMQAFSVEVEVHDIDVIH